jgi:hypothetical protein
MSAPIAAPPLRLVIVGHVDHGKSSLLGRLLADTGSLPEGRLDAIRAMSEKRGMAFEWAWGGGCVQGGAGPAQNIHPAPGGV